MQREAPKFAEHALVFCLICASIDEASFCFVQNELEEIYIPAEGADRDNLFLVRVVLDVLNVVFVPTTKSR